MTSTSPNLLLLSNSSSDAGYLVHALPQIAQWAESQIQHGQTRNTRVLFVPFAGVSRSWDDYEAQVAAALAPIGLAVDALHRAADPQAAIESARLIAVGGGNTFALLRELRRQRLLYALAARARSGAAAYLGWSAGANLACPTICTTNDMPIVDPNGLDALDLLPLQINPHYTDAHPPGHRGETRQQRLREFCITHPEVPVLGLPEGTGLRLHDGRYTLLGDAAAPLFVGRQDRQMIQPGPWSVR